MEGVLNQASWERNRPMQQHPQAYSSGGQFPSMPLGLAPAGVFRLLKALTALLCQPKRLTTQYSLK